MKSETWQRKNKAFKCRTFDARITKEACKINQSRAVCCMTNDPIRKCQTCVKFDKTLIKNAKKEVCRLEEEYPGRCLGNGFFIKARTLTGFQHLNKKFCTHECGMLHYRIKNGLNHD